MKVCMYYTYSVRHDSDGGGTEKCMASTSGVFCEAVLCHCKVDENKGFHIGDAAKKACRARQIIGPDGSQIFDAGVNFLSLRHQWEHPYCLTAKRVFTVNR